MAALFDAVLRFPTVLFTPLLVVVIGYWIVVIAGGTDPEGPEVSVPGLAGVPVPVTVSLLVVVAWFVSLAGAEFHGPVPLWVVPVVALVLAFLIVRIAAAWLRRLMPVGPEASRADFVGMTCVVRTGRVTRTFGQAEVRSSDGSSAIVQVRQAGEDDLRAGSEALLYDVDPSGDFFWVVPTDIAMKGH